MNSPEDANAPAGTEAKATKPLATETASVSRPIGRFVFEKAIRDDPNLSREAKLLGFVLATYMDAKTGECHPSKTTLAKKLGYDSPRSLEKPRAELTRSGHLKAVYSPRTHRTSYTALGHTLKSVFEEGSAESETRSGAYGTIRSGAGQEQPVDQQPKTSTTDGYGCSSDEEHSSESEEWSSPELAVIVSASFEDETVVREPVNFPAPSHSSTSPSKAKRFLDELQTDSTEVARPWRGRPYRAQYVSYLPNDDIRSTEVDVLSAEDEERLSETLDLTFVRWLS